MAMIGRDIVNNTITYYDVNLSCRKIIYGVYSEESELTFIMQDIIRNDTEECVSTEVVGFYFGEPNLKYIEQHIGDLKRYL